MNDYNKNLNSEWNKIISVKLKDNTSINDLIFNYGSNIEMPPNVVDSNSSYPSYLDLDSTSTPWINMASISGSNSTQINNLIHLALNQGANGLDILIEDNLDINDVLKGVITEYLDIRIRFNERVDIDKLTNQFNFKKNPNFRLVGKKYSFSQIDITNISKIEEFKSFLTSVKSSQNYDIVITLNKNILFEISFLRAIRQVLQTSYKLSNFNLLARYDVEGLTDLGDFNLIEKTFKVMSAIMGGVDTIMTEYKGDENSRLSLNIQNVLELESHFKYVINPVSGSFYLEQLTQQIIDKILD